MSKNVVTSLGAERECRADADYFAIIAGWIGEKDLALQQFALAGRTPGACLIANYGLLKLLPFWDPLRGDPRFEKILASLAPK